MVEVQILIKENMEEVYPHKDPLHSIARNFTANAIKFSYSSGIETYRLYFIKEDRIITIQPPNHQNYKVS